MSRTYATPMAFKTAIEQRLRDDAAALGMHLQRRRQLFVFDRFLARVFHVLDDAVVLEGGLVIELRLARARTTKDIDLRVVGSPDDLLSRLQEAGRLDLGDYLRFEVTPDPRHPEIDAAGMAYRGLRVFDALRLDKRDVLADGPFFQTKTASRPGVQVDYLPLQHALSLRAEVPRCSRPRLGQARGRAKARRATHAQELHDETSADLCW